MENNRQSPDRAAIEDLQAHLDRRLDDVVAMIKTGFPEGDLVEHRKSHEQCIKSAEEREELVKSIRDKSITGTFLSLATFAMLAVWEWFKGEVRR